MKPTSLFGSGTEYVAHALRLTERLDADGFPTSRDWGGAPVLRFDRNWKGQEADPARMTEVRLLWTPESLFAHFHANYRTLTVFSDSREDGWRDQLWDRDVAEVFLQPAGSDPRRYLEFEVSPNGFWIDLSIALGEKEDLCSGMRRKISSDAKGKTWTAELSLPIKSLTSEFNPKEMWRANFYRIEGEQEPRFYSAWSPTFTEQPNFHVPATFGTLLFR
jgi:alpha-galactosidase